MRSEVTLPNELSTYLQQTLFARKKKVIKKKIRSTIDFGTLYSSSTKQDIKPFE